MFRCLDAKLDDSYQQKNHGVEFISGILPEALQSCLLDRFDLLVNEAKMFDVTLKRREKGLSRSGNERVRKILIQLSWRMLQFQPDSGLVRWYKDRTANSQRSRKPMIVALARKLIIALWRYVNTGVVPEGFKLAK